MTIDELPFGQTRDGRLVSQFVLRQGPWIAKITNFGASLVELHLPDRAGNLADVVLGFDSIDGYLDSHPYFGATIGRVANRVAGAKFTLDGREYSLAANNGPHSLHGGRVGFDKALWRAEVVESVRGPLLTLKHVSPDGDEGYPGKLQMEVTFELTPDGMLRIVYQATSDRLTLVNLTNHSYFNLSGSAGATVLDHVLEIAAESYTPVDVSLIPTGEVAPVAGTPFDFRKPTAIGARIAEVPGGYDHNFVLNDGWDLSPVSARVFEPESGRVLEVLTTEPGLQFYSGNFLDGSLLGKGGVPLGKHSGFCLEAQHFPDAVHHPTFRSIELEPGVTYRQSTIYKFSVA